MKSTISKNTSGPHCLTKKQFSTNFKNKFLAFFVFLTLSPKSERKSILFSETWISVTQGVQFHLFIDILYLKKRFYWKRVFFLFVRFRVFFVGLGHIGLLVKSILFLKKILGRDQTNFALSNDEKERKWHDHQDRDFVLGFGNNSHIINMHDCLFYSWAYGRLYG